MSNDLPPPPFVPSTNPTSIEVGSSATATSLTLFVANPPGASAAVTLRGGAFPSAMDSEAGSADATQNPADTFFVYCHWGTEEEDLCSADAASNIVMAPTDNQDWTCGPATDPQTGPYWVLYSTTDTTLAPGESISFTMSNILSAAAAGMCLLFLQSNISTYAPGTSSCAIYKTEAAAAESG